MITANVKEPEQIKPKVEALKATAEQSIAPEKIQGIIELIDNAILCKFPTLTREELNRMFGLAELRQTRYYQDVFEEGELKGSRNGKLEAVPGLFQLGLSAEQIAEALKLNLSLVENVIADISPQDS